MSFLAHLLLLNTLLFTTDAHATVIWDDAPIKGVVMTGASSSWAWVDSVTYSCPGQSPDVHVIDESIDLVIGFELPEGLDNDCTIEVTLDDAFVIDGEDANGEWSVEVTQTTIVLTSPTSPVALSYDVLDGSPIDTPSATVWWE